MVFPCLDLVVASKPHRRIVAIVRFGVADQMNV
jgi:hypothetical protein